MLLNLSFYRNKILFYVLGIIVLLRFSTPVFADDFKNYDENIVRAYKTVKIGVLKSNLYLPADATEEVINQSINDYLVKSKFLKAKKQEIILFETQKISEKQKTGSEGSESKEFIVVNKLYNLKNPEKFLFALDRNKSTQSLLTREAITNSLVNNISEYAIISRKIDNKNLPLAWKITKASYNGFLNTIILTPKLGFGYVINPPFRWIKTNKPISIYNGISSEIEKLSTGQKQPMKVKCFVSGI
jgi:hypothetical protein